MKKAGLAFCTNLYAIKLVKLSPLLLLTALAACGGGGSTPDSNTSTITGVVQKGAFQNGANITVQELTSTATNDSHSSSTSVINNQGAYSLATDWTGWAETTITGRYYDEYAGLVVETPITLTGIQEISTGDQSFNVNLFSHFVAARIKYRVQNESETLASAKVASEQDLQTALELAEVDSDQLDIHEGSGENSNANAVLLLFSGGFMAVGDHNNLLTTLTDDFKIDGSFESASLEEVAAHANTPGLIDELASNLSSEGISDSPSESSLQTIPEWIETSNVAPKADSAAVSTNEDVSKEIQLIGSDEENDLLSFSIVTEPKNGQITLVDSTATYVPTANYHGADSFTFRVNDGNVNSALATVQITIAPSNDKPTVEDVNITVAEDSGDVLIPLKGADSDEDSLSFSIVDQPQNSLVSTISIDTDNNAFYRPKTNFTGSDSFTYKANDGTEDSNVATVSITVTAVNDPPRAVDSSSQTHEDEPVNIPLVGTDHENSNLSYSVVDQPQHGQVVINIIDGLAKVVYTPDENYNGEDSFTFKVNDGQYDSNIAKVGISVIAKNDFPVADAGSDVQVLEGQTVTLDGSNSSDLEGEVSYLWSPANDLDDAMKDKPVFTAPSVDTDTVKTLTLRVRDNDQIPLTHSDTVNVTILNLPAQPQNVEAEAGNQQITLSWDVVGDADAYDICVATEAITSANNCLSYADGVLVANETSPAVISSLDNGTEYHFVVIPSNDNGAGEQSADMAATPAPSNNWDDGKWDELKWQ